MPRVNLFRISPVIVAVCWSAVAFAQKSESSPLVKVADHAMVQARIGAAAAVLGDYIYIFGGSGGGAPIYKAERFDLRTGKSEALSPDFIARRYHGVVEHEGKFYLFGGETYARAGRAHEDKVEVYDPATHKVSVVGMMPRPRAKFAQVKLGNESWVIGGQKSKEGRSFAQTNEVEILDLTTMQWRPGPPMPTPRETSAALVGAFILVPGGYASRTTRDEVEMYVPAEQGWKRLPRLGQTISAHSTAMLGKWLFLFGDFELGDTVLAYELPTRKTIKVDCGFTESRHTVAVSTADRIYVIGGAGRDSGALGSSRGTNQAVNRGTERALIQEFRLR